MMEVLGQFHGLPGVFTACVFSAALRYILHYDCIQHYNNDIRLTLVVI
jgi:hypothetical protein